MTKLLIFGGRTLGAYYIGALVGCYLHYRNLKRISRLAD